MSFSPETRIGVLGGGQLGRMLIQSGIDLNLRFSVLDTDAQAPCRDLALFQQGSLKDFHTVLSWGRECDVITIEIEHVNTAALKQLEQEGKRVYPQPDIIELIQDKRTQKEFYYRNGIPTADYVLVSNRAEALQLESFLPAVNKLGKEGYDGRGVQVVRTASDLEKAFDAPGFLEKLVDFEKEIAVIVARNPAGEVKSFPAVEMAFHPEANLVEYLFSPAQISAAVAEEADRIARQVIEALGMVGLLAVEMFVTRNQQVLVNEIAPRPHNSGHHTIEANITSQYEQHLRAILDLPLGDTSIKIPGAMVNLLGEEGYSGPARYEGLEAVLQVPGAHIHLYGKHLTKPFRKMGHVTLVDHDMESLRKNATFVKHTLKVRT
ncbi:MAG: 5-(carboxyamino)imidazole ribonucleotide synthase [Cyclobacteriaceae bacterium]|nr:5-(carboxyamino)imidazole ribonucleotide synthase [Cyclobacteriaceae bacterium]